MLTSVQMGYRSYNRRRYQRNRRKARSTTERRGLIDDLIDLLISLSSRLFRAVAGLVWRSSESPAAASVRPQAVQREFNRSRRGTSTISRTARIESTLQQWQAAQLRAAEPLPYQRTQYLLSKGERAFWQPLYLAVQGRYRIFGKVRLADVICCPPDRRDERRWFRAIGRFHVDFVICEPRTTQPLLVIELDDRRHRQRARFARDDFKDAALRAAGVPIYRINAQQAYDPIELAKEIDRLIQA